MSGGSKGGGSSTTVSKMEPAAEVKPYLNPYMTHAAALSMKPYEAYKGNRIADWTPDQLRGFQMTREVANQANTAINNSANQLNRTLNGQYLNYSPGNNQYMGQGAAVGNNQYLGAQSSVGRNQYIGQNASVGNNQYLGATTSVGRNAYAGSNQYLDNAIRSTQDEMTRQFNNNVQNSTDAMMARSGAFGGSAWRQAQQANQESLNKQIGEVSNNMRMQDYGMQQQLAEADINRRIQAQQTDLARNAQLAQEGINLRNQSQHQDLARNAGLVESDLGRRLQAQQTDLARNSQLAQDAIALRNQSQHQDLARNAGLRQDQLNMLNSNWNNERQRQLQASQLIPSLTQGGYQNAQALLGIGDSIQGMNQDRLNMLYEDWLEKQNWDQRGLDIMGNAISRTMGAGGTTTNTAPNPNQRNRTASALGGALSGAALGAPFAGIGSIPGALIGGGLGLVGGLL